MDLPDVPTNLRPKELVDSIKVDDVGIKCMMLYTMCLEMLEAEKSFGPSSEFETFQANPYYADSIMQKLIQAGYLVEKKYDDISGSYNLKITNPFF